MVDNNNDKLTVKKASNDDVNNGWVRINVHNSIRRGIKRKDLVSIKVKNDNGVIDNNSILYRRIFGTDKRNVIIMDYETRYNDGKWDLHENEEYIFEIEKIMKRWFWIWWYYYWSHPNDAIRISSRLGSISVFMAFISICIAVFI